MRNTSVGNVYFKQVFSVILERTVKKQVSPEADMLSATYETFFSDRTCEYT